MLDLDRKFLLDLSHAALQAVVEQTPGVKWTRYDTLSPYSSVSLSAQHPGLKLRSRVAGSGDVSHRHLEWAADCDGNVALDIHRQQSCSVTLSCKAKDTLLRKRQQQSVSQPTKLPEARLEKVLLDEPPAELRGFPYLCARDYVSAGGKGDLVFTDGHGLYAVIEVKRINLQGSNRTKKRQKVKGQARKYGQAFRTDNATAVVVVAACYTEESDRLQWIALNGQNLIGVQHFIEAVAATTCDIRTASSSGEPLVSHKGDSARQGSAESEATWVAAAAEVTFGVTDANEPIMSHEAKQHLAMGAGIAGIIALELYLNRYERRQRRREKQEDLEFMLVVFAVVLASLCGVWVSFFYSIT